MQSSHSWTHCPGLRDEPAHDEVLALCLDEFPHEPHPIPRHDEPRVYLVRGAVARAVNDLMQTGVPGLTDEEVIAGIAAEALLRAEMRRSVRRDV